MNSNLVNMSPFGPEPDGLEEHNSDKAGTDLIIRGRNPINFESPFERLHSFLTPTEQFYIRSHFEAPELNTSEYRLKIGGAVTKEVSFTYSELREMPSETRIVTLECAGNSRIHLTPPAEGVQWGLGAVSTAEWTGVPLRHLIERAGLEEDACEIVFGGADRGIPKEKPTPPDAISYSRSLSVRKAIAPEVLVAYAMNGHELTVNHGYPVRLIVPGHYGMASVKWLTGIYALREPFQGYWQTSDYAYWHHMQGHVVRRPLSTMFLKAQIAQPAIFQTLSAGKPFTVAGAAWSGDSTVVGVDVSADSGSEWSRAEMLDPSTPFAWRRWRLNWDVPARTGRYSLVARAWDADGRTQPEAHDPHFGPYAVHHTIPIEILVA